MKHGKLKLPCSAQVPPYLPLSHAEEKRILHWWNEKHHTCPDATLNGSAPQFSELNQIGACTSDVIPSRRGAVCPSFLDCDHGPTLSSLTSAHREHSTTTTTKETTPYNSSISIDFVTTTVQNHSPISDQNKKNRQNVCKYCSRQEHQLRYKREGGQGLLLFLVSCTPSQFEMSVANNHLQWQDH